MANNFKKTFLTGLGLISLSKKKLEESVKETANKHGISQREAEKLARDLWRNVENKREDLEEDYEKVYAKTLKKMNIPTREEFEELKQKVDDLEKSSKSASFKEKNFKAESGNKE
ncbi:MAG: phasin family protein [Candidatus Moraniibacteriota bacterium]